MAELPSELPTKVPNVAWSDVVRFIRQLGHDLRNHLNAIELQSAYITELERDDELKGEIKRLREMIGGMTSTLQTLSRNISDVKPNLIAYRADDFMEDLRKKIDRDFSGQTNEITWNIQPSDAMLNIDPQLLPEAFAELFANAFRHTRGKGTVAATAKTDNDGFLFTLEEPKPKFDLATNNWGHEPLRKVSPGHYSLGLNRVRVIVEAHGGEMYAQYDPKTSALTTSLSLPVSSGSMKDA
jgi:K+-sensing histidine kinase KdpD